MKIIICIPCLLKLKAKLCVRLVAVSVAGEGNSAHLKRFFLKPFWIRKGEEGKGKSNSTENIHEVQSRLVSFSPLSVCSSNKQKSKAVIMFVPSPPELFQASVSLRGVSVLLLSMTNPGP